MGSSVTLYKLKYNNSTVNKPYFETESARENFFSRAVGSKVLENASVTQLENLEVEITVRVDISSFDYNYAVVKGQREYYLFIMDIRKMAFGVTTLRCKIDISTQLLDPFSKFSEMYVDSISCEEFHFGSKYDVHIPELNGVRTSIPITDVQFGGQNCKLITALFIKCSPSSESGEFRNGLSYTDYDCYIKIYDLPNSKSFFAWNRSNNLIEIVPSKDFTKLPDDITPRIISMYYMPIPVIEKERTSTKVSYVLPFISEATSTNSILRVFYPTLVSPNYPPLNRFPNPLKFSYSFIADITHKYEIWAYSSIEPFLIDPIQFVSDTDKTIKIEFTILFSNSFPLMFICIKGASGDIVNRITPTGHSAVIDLKSGVSYTISSKASFLAENKYYEQETNTTIGFMTGKLVNHLIGSKATGLTQMLLGGDIMGASNIVRGEFEAIGAAIDIGQYKVNRDLTYKTFTERPAESVDIQDPNIPNATTNLSILLVETVPFEQELNEFSRRNYIRGYECAIIANKSELIARKSSNNRLYVKGEIVIDYPLTNTEIVELKNIFRNGVCWEFYN